MPTRKTKRKRKRQQEKLRARQTYAVTFGPPGCTCVLCEAGPIPIDLEAIMRKVETTWILVELRSDASTCALLPWTPRIEKIPPAITTSRYIELIMALAPDLLDDGPCELLINGARTTPDTIINEGDHIMVTRTASLELSSARARARARASGELD